MKVRKRIEGKTGAVCRAMCTALVLVLMLGVKAHPAMGETFTSKASAAKTVAKQVAESNFSRVRDLGRTASIDLTADGDQLKASWGAVDDAVNYRVLLLSDAAALVEATELTAQSNEWTLVEGTSCSFKKLAEGDYRLAVMAVASEVDEWNYGVFHYGLIVYSDVIHVEGYDFYLSGLKQTGLDQVTISWNAYDKGSKLQILCSTSKNGSYSVVDTITDMTATSASVTISSIGTKQYYKVLALDEMDQVVGDSNILGITPGLYKPIVTAACSSPTSIRISWNHFMDGLAGYEIRYSSTQTGSYKLLTRVTEDQKTSYLNSKLTPGTTRYYKVRVFTLKADGTRKYSSYSNVVKATARLQQTKWKELSAVDDNSAYLGWEKVTGATGYQVMQSSSKDGTYSRKATVTENISLGVITKNLKAGSTYYYKVRAYKTLNGKTYYGAYSTAKSITMPKTVVKVAAAVCSAVPATVAGKCMKIFGTTSLVRYSSRTQAEKDMVSINIRCWDFKDSSRTTKITKTYTILVHKNIAAEVKAVFEEIYNGKEKFPIKSVGGYSWRGDGSLSEHNLGLAIDINPDENYFYNFVTNTILCGKYWKPGEDPYSIPAGGDVENAFLRHGFTRGLWSQKNDYMHFSYFGT